MSIPQFTQYDYNIAWYYPFNDFSPKPHNLGISFKIHISAQIMNNILSKQDDVYPVLTKV